MQIFYSFHVMAGTINNLFLIRIFRFLGTVLVTVTGRPMSLRRDRHRPRLGRVEGWRGGRR